ncbi:MAG TPA: hypothetical protein VKJ65_13075 [Phycisphaerae bacterium]|nr:hypothetical protein [Phycisphaerae bacterium]
MTEIWGIVCSGIFSGALVIVTGVLAHIAYQQNQITKTIHRAYVFIRETGFSIVWDETCNPRQVRGINLWLVFENSGATSVKNLVVRFHITEIKDIEKFDYNKSVGGLIKQKSELLPRSQIRGPLYFKNTAQIDEIFKNKLHLLCFGDCNYGDGFGGIFTNEFYYKIILGGNMNVASNMVCRYEPCGEHNQQIDNTPLNFFERVKKKIVFEFKSEKWD